ncbi:MAG: hypothetical protein ACD_29C00247G0004 [uncultured bacterium]|nr:MAG: hypothetical protein ACD_29C00247G0004 [uncultured bacterium]
MRNVYTENMREIISWDGLKKILNKAAHEYLNDESVRYSVGFGMVSGSNYISGPNPS